MNFDLLFQLDAVRESELEQVSVMELFTNSYYHKPLMISVVLQLAQQLSGIGGVSRRVVGPSMKDFPIPCVLFKQ